MQRSTDEILNECFDARVHIFKHLKSTDRVSLSLVSTLFDKAYRQSKKNLVCEKINELLKKYHIQHDLPDHTFAYLPLDVLNKLYKALNAIYTDKKNAEKYFIELISQQNLNIDSTRYWFLVILAILKITGAYSFQLNLDKKNIEVTAQNLSVIKRLVMLVAANRNKYFISTDNTYINSQVTLYGQTSGKELAVNISKLQNDSEFDMRIRKLKTLDVSQGNAWIYELIELTAQELGFNSSIQAVHHRVISNNDIRNALDYVCYKDKRLARSFVTLYHALNIDELALISEQASVKHGHINHETFIKRLIRAIEISREVTSAINEIFGQKVVFLWNAANDGNCQLLTNTILKYKPEFDIEDLIEIIRKLKEKTVCHPIYIFSLLITGIVSGYDRSEILAFADNYFAILTNLNQTGIGQDFLNQLVDILRENVKKIRIGANHIKEILHLVIKYHDLFNSSEKAGKYFLKYNVTPRLERYLDVASYFTSHDQNLDKKIFFWQKIDELIHILETDELVQLIKTHLHPFAPLWKFPRNSKDYLINIITKNKDNPAGLNNFLGFVNNHPEMCDRIKEFADRFLNGNGPINNEMENPRPSKKQRRY